MKEDISILSLFCNNQLLQLKLMCVNVFMFREQLVIKYASGQVGLTTDTYIKTDFPGNKCSPDIMFVHITKCESSIKKYVCTLVLLWCLIEQSLHGN